MTKTAIWCRHENDNIIAIDGQIPWTIGSDIARFWRMVDGKTLVMGRLTYETMPEEQLNNHQIFVLSHDHTYQTKNLQKHQVVTNPSLLKDCADDLYICGGAEIYRQFIEKFTVEIIVDCCYCGEVANAKGKVVEISKSVELMEQKYRQISAGHEQDGVSCAIWIKKGEFVAQEVLKHLILAIEQN